MSADLAAAQALDGAPLLVGKQDNTSLTKSLLAYVWARPDRGWLLSFLIALSGSGALLVAIIVTLARGIGTWGNNIPIGWGFGIIN
ncbi:MAG TPA: hydrogenase, partial [Myxococcaceae bacterium]|nr:hydrogenase [Myxococcaceae bacterium]